MLKKVAYVLAALAALGVVLVFAFTVLEYHPDDVEAVAIEGQASDSLAQGDSFDVVAWNLGYCGLSAEADFFMDGGSSVQAVDRDGVERNLSAAISELSQLDADIILLQEVDRNSSRTYNIDQAARIVAGLGSGDASPYTSAFAYNFCVAFLPYPIPPIGTVNSGILTLSRFPAEDSPQRVQLPCPFTWPMSTVNLKRCLLIERIPVTAPDGRDRELVLINLHLEAYDDGTGKAAQSAQLASIIREERAKGNYVVVGGDFNQSFSTVDTSAYPVQGEGLWECGYLDAAEFGDQFSLLMDARTPTCRSLDRPYSPDDPTFQYYMIDGFIVSDNVRVDELETIDLGFEHSDHNPVRIRLTLLS